MSNKNLTTFLSEWGRQVKALIEPSTKEKLEPSIVWGDIADGYFNPWDMNNFSLSSGMWGSAISESDKVTIAGKYAGQGNLSYHYNGQGGYFVAFPYTVTSDCAEVTITGYSYDAGGDESYGITMIGGTVGTAFIPSNEEHYVTLHSEETDNYKAGSFYTDAYF